MDPCALERSFWKTPSGIAFLAFPGAMLFFLPTKHTAQLVGALPDLPLLA